MPDRHAYREGYEWVNPKKRYEPRLLSSGEEREEEDVDEVQKQKEDSDSKDRNEDLEGDNPKDEEMEDPALAIRDPEVPDFDIDGFGVEATITDDGEDGTYPLATYDESRIKRRGLNNQHSVITE